MRRGSTIMFTMISMAVLMGLVSLGVDLGRMQAVKTELQRAVDASARYGARGLIDGTAVDKAIAAGADNTIDADDHTALALTSANVTLGYWDSDACSFTAGAGSKNAVKVTATRTIPVLFAAVLGKRSCSVTASAIGYLNVAAPNFIGLNSINAKNNASFGYNSSKGSPGGVNQNNSFLMGSNGSITFNMNPSISGGIVLGPSGTYNQSSPSPMVSTTPLSYPATESPPAPSSGDLSVNGTMHVSGGGTLVYTNINFGNNSTLIFDAPTTVYVTGNVATAQNSAIQPASGVPKDLMIRMTGGGSAYFGGTNSNNLAVTALVYAPDVDFTSKNDASLYGSMLFRSIDVKNNLYAYYDTDSGSVVAGLGSVGGSTVSLVR